MEPLLTTDACTMPTDDRPLRLAEFDALSSTAVVEVQNRDTTIQMRMAGQERLADVVRHLTT